MLLQDDVEICHVGAMLGKDVVMSKTKTHYEVQIKTACPACRATGRSKGEQCGYCDGELVAFVSSIRIRGNVAKYKTHKDALEYLKRYLCMNAGRIIEVEEVAQ